MNKWLFPFLYILADVLIIGGIIGTVVSLNPFWLLISVIGLWKKDFYDRCKEKIK